MLESLQARPPYKGKQYNLEEIDHNLSYLSKLLVNSTGPDRKSLLRLANQWLDKRIKINAS